MEEIGELQRWGIFFIGLVWGFLAILISLTYFTCEFKPTWCEKGVELLRKLFKPFDKKR